MDKFIRVPAVAVDERADALQPRLAVGQQRQALARCLEQGTREHAGVFRRCAFGKVERRVRSDRFAAPMQVPPLRLAVLELEPFAHDRVQVVVAVHGVTQRNAGGIQAPARDERLAVVPVAVAEADLDAAVCPARHLLAAGAPVEQEEAVLARCRLRGKAQQQQYAEGDGAHEPRLRHGWRTAYNGGNRSEQ